MTDERADEIEISALRKMIADLEEAQKKYAAALMVYDVTVACLEPFLNETGNVIMGLQKAAARDAYRAATGEEPFQLREFDSNAVADDDETGE